MEVTEKVLFTFFHNEESKLRPVFVKQSIEEIIAALFEEYNVMLRKEEQEQVVCVNKKYARAKPGSIGKFC